MFSTGVAGKARAALSRKGRERRRVKVYASAGSSGMAKNRKSKRLARAARLLHELSRVVLRVSVVEELSRWSWKAEAMTSAQLLEEDLRPALERQPSRNDPHALSIESSVAGKFNFATAEAETHLYRTNSQWLNTK